MTHSTVAFPSLELTTEAALAGKHKLVLVPKNGELAAAQTKGLAAHLKSHSALKGERGAKLVLHGATTQIFLGIGTIKTFTEQEAAELGEQTGYTINGELLAELGVIFPKELNAPSVAANFLKGLSLANFHISEFRSKPEARKHDLKKILFTGGASQKLDKDELAVVAAVAKGIAFARALVEAPSNVAHPEGVVARFKNEVDSKIIQLEVWDEKRIKKEGMGLLHAVSQGSTDCPPRFLVARYGKDFLGKPTSKKSKKPALYLVGKGVTFDTGGINLKAIHYKELLAMKGDMAGAAAVLGAMLAIQQIRPALSVVAITPLTKNSIGSKAIIPGDVVTSYSGKTVEIQNTDAEGRLILADALHFAHSENASCIVDVATLTGACAVALGAHLTGVFSNNEDFQAQVRDAAARSGEPAWPMPMAPRYGEELKSTLADLSNMGKGREGGATLGAKFLENFVGHTPWCHLDIAGSADLGAPVAGAQVRAAGRMVHTLVSLALDLAD